MSKPTAYERVTDLILERLEAGVVPWHKPWAYDGDGAIVLPRNLQTRNEYRGSNVWTLSITAGIKGYQSEWWLTYKQAQTMGGQVRKGEKSAPGTRWGFTVDKSCAACRSGADSGHKSGCKSSPFLRGFSVFNLEQIDGIDYPKPVASDPIPEFEAIGSAEKIVKGYSGGPGIRLDGRAAFYRPDVDQVTMPAPGHFEKPTAYYSTLFHELGHSTGHQTRLNRKFGARFADHAYSREELVAELSSAMLCGVAGIEQDTLDQSASYLDHWASKLRDEPKWFVTAAGQAEKASNRIRGIA